MASAWERRKVAALIKGFKSKMDINLCLLYGSNSLMPGLLGLQRALK